MHATKCPSFLRERRPSRETLQTTFANARKFHSPPNACPAPQNSTKPQKPHGNKTPQDASLPEAHHPRNRKPSPPPDSSDYPKESALQPPAFPLPPPKSQNPTARHLTQADCSQCSHNATSPNKDPEKYKSSHSSTCKDSRPEVQAHPEHKAPPRQIPKSQYHPLLPINHTKSALRPTPQARERLPPTPNPAKTLPEDYNPKCPLAPIPKPHLPNRNANATKKHSEPTTNSKKYLSSS